MLAARVETCCSKIGLLGKWHKTATKEMNALAKGSTQLIRPYSVMTTAGRTLSIGAASGQHQQRVLVKQPAVFSPGSPPESPDVTSTVMGRRWESDYASVAVQELISSTTTLDPERSLYRESETRDLLARYPGGSVTMTKDEEDGVARINIRHDGRKNAFSGTMMLELADKVAELSQWTEGRAVFIRGSSGDFCTGGDLTFVEKIATPVLGAKMSILMGSVLARLHQLPIISVAQVDGYALGGGAELICACDFRVMSKTASVGFVHGRLGVSPGWGGGTHLASIIGSRSALRLMATGEVIDADECYRMGLADFVYRDESEVEQWWDKFTKVPCDASRAAKRIVLNAVECNYAESLNRERDIFTELWGSPRHVQSLQKLSNRRESESSRT